MPTNETRTSDRVILTIVLLTLLLTAHLLRQTDRTRQSQHVSRQHAEINRPTISFVRFEVDSDHDVGALLEFRNDTDQPFYFFGYGEEFPQLVFQCRINGQWQDVDWHGCGTGVEPRELLPGHSFEFYAGLSAWTDIRDNLELSLLSYEKPLRVGPLIGSSPETIDTRLWSSEIDSIRVAQMEHKR